MTGLDRLVRENVKNLTPYSCARDEYRGRDGIFLDANENPFGSLNRYPDPYQKELKSVISRIKNVPPEKIFLGNGSDEIIDLCFRIFCDPGIDKALTFSPSYGMYEVSAAANDVEIIRIPLTDKFYIEYDKIIPWLSDENLKLILICSPNNPTGNCQDKKVVERIISSFRGIVLLDEAYIDFAGTPSFKDRIDDYPNLIVMQTMSKAFGMASVRVGMAFADTGIIKYFNKMKPPYNISTVNQNAVLKKLTDISSYRKEVAKIIEERERLSSGIRELPVTEKVYPSDANFLLVKFSDADMVYNYLVNKGIVVRNRSRVVCSCLRITVGTRSENTRLLKALKSIQP
ncbi:MAG: histidinol-phosphate transaminase [Bacteroidetes bacterium RBG_13_44_24]|nr:MAG: histidinol-phosphate transaminase [Bacteroidetes bacterium RBG_13_44_24]